MALGSRFEVESRSDAEVVVGDRAWRRSTGRRLLLWGVLAALALGLANWGGRDLYAHLSDSDSAAVLAIGLVLTAVATILPPLGLGRLVGHTTLEVHTGDGTVRVRRRIAGWQAREDTVALGELPEDVRLALLAEAEPPRDEDTGDDGAHTHEDEENKP